MSMSVEEVRKALSAFGGSREVMTSEDGFTRASIGDIVLSGDEVLILMERDERESNP